MRLILTGVDPTYRRKRCHVWTPSNPEGFKLLLGELVVSAGVQVRLTGKLRISTRKSIGIWEYGRYVIRLRC
jgi:hypothetical protein